MTDIAVILEGFVQFLRRTHTIVSDPAGEMFTIEYVTTKFYFYGFDDGSVVAIDAHHPKYERYLRTNDGTWYLGYRIKP